MKNITSNIFHVGLIKEAGNGNSYFVKGDGSSANWLINSPEPTAELLEQLQQLGGVDYIFGTHRDVVCHVDAMAKHFNAKRIINKLDIEALPDAEIVLVGDQEQILADDANFLAVPAPGHTEGHCMLLYADRFLFSGDAMEVSGDELIVGPAEWTWQSAELNIESVRRLASMTLSCLLPDHGESLQLDSAALKTRILAAAERASSASFDPAERSRALNIYIGQMRHLGQTEQENKMLAELGKIALHKRD